MRYRPAELGVMIARTHDFMKYRLFLVTSLRVYTTT